MFHDHTYCRACGYAKPGVGGIKSGPQSENLLPVFDLGLQPMANDFCKPGDDRSGYAPLKVLLCPRCHLAQLSVVVKPEILYARNYAYVTSPSQTMREHFDRLYKDIAEMFGQTLPGSVIEIGSNDGLLLAHLRDSGSFKVLGIDPAPNLCAAAKQRGVETVNAFWNAEIASMLAPNRKTDVIIARHVFCHCPDWKDFVAGLEALAHRDTLILIETPYVQDLLDKTEFDTIYHEHLSYLSLKSVVELLKGTSLQLHRVIRYPIHGGAVMLCLRRRDFAEPPHKSVEQFLAAEDVGPEKWAALNVNSAKAISQLKSKVMECRQLGKNVAALGASAKFTVLANACGFTRKDISFVADTTMAKWYSTVPGTDIGVTDEGAILRELPDYVVLGAWNFKAEVLAKQEVARSKGVKFIIPIPSVSVE